ncbi:efflux transporter outer membrane subunit [Sphingomonas sp. ID0503]|uniref:efflux transporter outer membrane subunit n=1 Tax=Sphingomonas sp. ID0503 TaxID=3399691 RepID=UPI003AFB0ECE
MTMRAIGLALCLALSACATAGLDYRPPEHAAANLPAATGPFDAARGPSFSAEEAPDAWWRLYDDPRLDGLVTQALAANADLRAADANLTRAEAVLREVAAGRTLSTSIGGGASLDRPSQLGGSLPGVVGYSLGLSLAYPLDVRGQISRAIEASEGDRQAVLAARDSARATVAASVVRAYANVCGANYSLAVNARVTAVQRDTLAATRRLAQGGRGTAFDVSRAEAALRNSEAALPAFAAQRDAALYALAALLGRPAADYPREVAACATLPRLNRALPAGDGAGLIRRRPDIRAAERTIAADTARIGVEVADLYPQVSLGGSVGLDGPVSRLGSGSSFGFSLGPLISWSFPNRPVVRARIAQAEAQVQGDLARFDATVLGALRDAETALATYARDRERLDALIQARDSAQLSTEQAGRLFRFGRSDFLSLLDAQRTLADSEALRTSAEVQLVDDEVRVFEALGGGWQ